MNVTGPAQRPVLVLSNALGTTAAVWDPQLSALGAFDVVRYEHPPYASVAELGRGMLRLVRGRFSLCGLSLGGMVGMWLAVHAPERLDRLVLACTSANMQLAVPPEDYAPGLEAIGAFDFRDALAQIAAPTLVIAGAEDPATTVADAQFLAERIPAARLAVIPGAAHLANVEQPERFNAELVRHLTGAA